ncbi:MAG TPA: hypothetical protein VKG38_05955 [Solirubrobacteraceae bacterium]|nr:hypothetical protein [Solirubrobacteraceae bacterium]
MTAGESGNEYRAEFKNGAGDTPTTAARLTVTKEAVPPPVPLPETPISPGIPQVQPLPFVVTKEPPPGATIATASVTVPASGKVTITVKCPTGVTSCTGTVTLRTAGAVIADVRGQAAKAKTKAAVLTLASGSFSASGGQGKAVTLHLSTKARALLARTHTVHAKATILSRDPEGVTDTTLGTLTLRAQKSGHHG